MIKQAVRTQQREDAQSHLQVNGEERAAINELLFSPDRVVDRAWPWRHSRRINLLESSVLREWLKDLRRHHQGSRAFGSVDSRVTLGSTSKGCSASRAITSILEQEMLLILAGGLCPSCRSGPSRLNVADDPTRNRAPWPPAHPPPRWMKNAAWLEWACAVSPATAPFCAWARPTLGILVARGDVDLQVLLRPSACRHQRPIARPIAARPREASRRG